MTLRVLIVDDHEVARAGIAHLLHAIGFVVVGSASSGLEALEMLGKDPGIDILMLDIRMPDLDGLVAMERILKTHKNAQIVVMSAYDNPTYIARAAALGARDFLIKGSNASLVEASLRSAAAGQEPPKESRLAIIANMMRQEIDVSRLPPELPLTSREAQVLRHIALGLSNKEIARSLLISVETVKEHVQNILRKTNCNDRTDAAVRAIRLGLAD